VAALTAEAQRLLKKLETTIRLPKPALTVTDVPQDTSSAPSPAQAAEDGQPPGTNEAP